MSSCRSLALWFWTLQTRESVEWITEVHEQARHVGRGVYSLCSKCCKVEDVYFSSSSLLDAPKQCAYFQLQFAKATANESWNWTQAADSYETSAKFFSLLLVQRKTAFPVILFTWCFKSKDSAFFLSFDDDGDDAAAADETEETDFSTRVISSQEAKMFKAEQRCGIVHMSKHLPRSSAADNGGGPTIREVTQVSTTSPGHTDVGSWRCDYLDGWLPLRNAKCLKGALVFSVVPNHRLSGPPVLIPIG